MKIDDLDYQEKGLIEILRTFKFLKQLNYQEEEIRIGGRGNPSIIYYNRSENRILKILGDESESWSIVIQRRRLIDLNKSDSFFDISDYYHHFDGEMFKGKNYSLMSQAMFIQHYLMPVIKGEIWINELISPVRHSKIETRKE
ncbi:MAG: hypothetical protein H6536_00645 [Bacteroidales bacterium]|nr:hypothetical protein [Bacteroidales bacterium]